MFLKVKKLNPNAQIPMQPKSGDAGYDLYSLNGGTVPARGKLIVPTGIAVDFTDYNTRMVGFIKSRSGLSAKNDIEAGAGVIDENYRGELNVILRNHSDVDFYFSKHSRIAQLVLLPIYTPRITEVEDLEDTIRGDLGFGSTGLE